MDKEPAREIEREIFGMKICAKIIPKNHCHDQNFVHFKRNNTIKRTRFVSPGLVPLRLFVTKKWNILRREIHFLSVEDIPRRTATLPEVDFMSQNTSAGFRFLWPCIVSKVWRERKKPTRCNNQMFIINFCRNMFRASLCPSSREQRPCVTAYGVLRCNKRGKRRY